MIVVELRMRYGTFHNVERLANNKMCSTHYFESYLYEQQQSQLELVEKCATPVVQDLSMAATPGSSPAPGLHNLNFPTACRHFCAHPQHADTTGMVVVEDPSLSTSLRRTSSCPASLSKLSGQRLRSSCSHQ